MSLLDKNKAKIEAGAAKPAPVAEKAEVEEPKEPEFLYAVTGGLAEFTLNLSTGTVKSVLGRMSLNEEQHKELQKLLKSGRPDISQHLQLVDLSEAERIAKEHMAATRVQAHRGASSTASAHLLTQEIAKDEIRNLDVIEEEVLHAGDGPLADQPFTPPA